MIHKNQKKQANPSKRLVHPEVCFYRKADYSNGRVKGPSAHNLLAKKKQNNCHTVEHIPCQLKHKRPPHQPHLLTLIKRNSKANCVT